jgi:hypothetical protein
MAQPPEITVQYGSARCGNFARADRLSILGFRIALGTAFPQNIRKKYGMDVADLPRTVTNKHAKSQIKSMSASVR